MYGADSAFACKEWRLSESQLSFSAVEKYRDEHEFKRHDEIMTMNRLHDIHLFRSNYTNGKYVADMDVIKTQIDGSSREEQLASLTIEEVIEDALSNE